jgi:hypothetical protein
LMRMREAKTMRYVLGVAHGSRAPSGRPPGAPPPRTACGGNRPLRAAWLRRSGGPDRGRRA